MNNATSGWRDVSLSHRIKNCLSFKRLHASGGGSGNYSPALEGIPHISEQLLRDKPSASTISTFEIPPNRRIAIRRFRCGRIRILFPIRLTVPSTSPQRFIPLAARRLISSFASSSHLKYGGGCSEHATGRGPERRDTAEAR